jgi:hypothetical protein
VRQNGNESPQEIKCAAFILCSNSGIRKKKKPGSAASMLANAGHNTRDGELLVQMVCALFQLSLKMCDPTS